MIRSFSWLALLRQDAWTTRAKNSSAARSEPSKPGDHQLATGTLAFQYDVATNALEVRLAESKPELAKATGIALYLTGGTALSDGDLAAHNAITDNLKLTTVITPAVTRLGPGALRGNPALTAVYLGSTPPKQEADIFTASPKATVYHTGDPAAWANFKPSGDPGLPVRPEP